MKCVCGFDSESSELLKFRNVKILYREPVVEKEGEPHNKATDYIWELDSFICPECGTIKINK